ncbi:MAG TPA: phosphatase PAP2 family protein, partial [Candidatus Acidoferrales bacterium]|nr:phosphatase PAP2 family protein [Candidatus Acidoferrales bacterium]
MNCLLCAGLQGLGATYAFAQTSNLQGPISSQSSPVDKPVPTSQGPDQTNPKGSPDSDVYQDNSLGKEFLKHLASDQKAIWTSPAHLRWEDGSWLFPLAAVSGGLFATDRAVPPVLSKDQTKLNHYVSISNYGLYSMVAAGGGLYILGKMTHDDHKRETGVLAGEAAINAFAINTAFKYAFGRERPNADQGLGDFFRGGASFPSDHSAVAWSIASVIAHEYPGALTQMAAYGMATVVSVARVGGKQHFPSDVLVGGAIGWLIGRQVYRAHHDPELGGGGWDPLSGNDDGEDRRVRQKMGSPSVPLDDWVYPAFERLAALGYIHTQLMGLKPWTRIECARLTEEAGETLAAEPGSNEEEA